MLHTEQQEGLGMRPVGAYTFHWKLWGESIMTGHKKSFKNKMNLSNHAGLPLPTVDGIQVYIYNIAINIIQPLAPTNSDGLSP